MSMQSRISAHKYMQVSRSRSRSRRVIIIIEENYDALKLVDVDEGRRNKKTFPIQINVNWNNQLNDITIIQIIIMSHSCSSLSKSSKKVKLFYFLFFTTFRISGQNKWPHSNRNYSTGSSLERFFVYVRHKMFDE